MAQSVTDRLYSPFERVETFNVFVKVKRPGSPGITVLLSVVLASSEKLVPTTQSYVFAISREEMLAKIEPADAVPPLTR